MTAFGVNIHKYTRLWLRSLNAQEVHRDVVVKSHISANLIGMNFFNKLRISMKNFRRILGNGRLNLLAFILRPITRFR